MQRAARQSKAAQRKREDEAEGKTATPRAGVGASRNGMGLRAVAVAGDWPSLAQSTTKRETEAGERCAKAKGEIDDVNDVMWLLVD